MSREQALVLSAHGLSLDARLTASLAPSRNPTCVARTRDGVRVFVKRGVLGDPGVDAERAALVALADEPSVPRVVVSAPGFLATRWISGQTMYELRRRRGQGASRDEAIGRALGRVQRAPGVVQTSRGKEKRFAQAGGAKDFRARVPGDFATRAVWTTPEVLAAASRAVIALISRVQRDQRAQDRLIWLLGSERDAPRGVVHGDCRQPNVLVQRDGIVFVDWEASGLGDPARDIGMLLADDYRAWLAPETKREWQTERARDAHFERLLSGWEEVWGGGHRERVWGWLAESLLRNEFARAHHLHVVKEHVVSAALTLLKEGPQ